MIVSASRRTDIPAFYCDWLFNRIKEGFVYVVNPFNRKQVSKVSLQPQDVDCFVFWTKDAGPILPRLEELDGYNYYFQFTLTPYRKDIEPNIRPKKEIIKTFKELSERIGRERVIWRYDPILLSDDYSLDYHQRAFEKLMEELSPYTERCIISFLDLYRKIDKNIRNLHMRTPDEHEIYQMAEEFAELGRIHSIRIETCSEKIDLHRFGVQAGSCIDGYLISRLLGESVSCKKDDTQREECGCAKSVDIGQYNTCFHGCRYCYASFNHTQAEENYKNHDASSPLITGRMQGDETITERKMPSIREPIQEKMEL